MKTARSDIQQEGSSMLMIMMVLATLSTCIVAALSFTSQTNRNVERSNTLRQGLEIGDGIMDYAFAHWRETCRSKTNEQLPSADFSNIPIPPTPAPSPAPMPYTLTNYKVKAADQKWKALTTDSATPVPIHGMSAGSVNYNYIASADLTLAALGATPIQVKLRRVFTKSQLSPWNFAIFYANDLEHHPGAASVVNGWVHTNGKLYTAHNTLSYQSKVSYGDDWEKNFKPGDPRRTTSPQPGPNWVQTLPPFRDSGQQPFGLDSSQIVAGGNPNDDSYRELVEMPATNQPDPIAEARYYNQADIKVTVDGNKVATFYNRSGNVITSSSTGNDKKLYDAISASINVGATITDKREGGGTVRLVDIDVGKLINRLNGNYTVPEGSPAPTAATFNGVLYVSDRSATTTYKRAVRLKNGAIIDRAGGLTVATDNGLYIQGDYNTGRTSMTETPSNNGNAAQPNVSGYERKPSAVVADAVMILSNNWNDANSSSGLSSRIATPTTVNTAIVSGIVPTASGNYSGGAENFPRLLERWTNKTFTYYGSMVQLYYSQQFKSPWKETGDANNVYDAPTRRWYFDPIFYTTPPPGTLKLVSYNKGRWFLEP